MARRALWTWIATLATLLAACTPRQRATSPAGNGEPVTRCDYVVRVVDGARAIVEVTARCDGDQAREFVAYEREAWPHLEVFSPGGAPLESANGRYALPTSDATIRYRIDLTSVAADAQNIDVAYRSGDAWVAASSTFLLRPVPASRNARANVRFDVPPASFATGLSPANGHHQLRVGEVGHATYTVFGHFERHVLNLAGPMASAAEHAGSKARLELVTLPGHLNTDVDTRLRWIEDAANAVSEFWHGFPVQRALMIVIPAPGYRDIAHGKVVATGGATVALHVGSEATRADLYRDWILVHELFHLGFPSFAGEGKWLDEGLATYYEPIIRTRAGWRDERALWTEFAHDMGQGLSAVETGMAYEKSYAGIYWGGAIIALMADLEARKRSEGRVGLEDGLRAVLARGGDATHVWKLDDVIAVVDERLGAPVLRRLSDAHRHRGKRVDLEQLFGQLGVVATERGVRFDDAADFAPLRKSLVSPPP